MGLEKGRQEEAGRREVGREVGEEQPRGLRWTLWPF